MADSKVPVDTFEVALQAFIRRLQRAAHHASVYNPYRYRFLRENLAHYLRCHYRRGTRVLLVGEALGFRGGRLTGLPFSSGKLIRESDHPFWRELREDLVVKQVVGEATASIIWQVLEAYKQPPLMWNAFPFHPTMANEPMSNRMPTRAELSSATAYFAFFQQHYPLQRIIAVGKHADRALSMADIPHAVVRHPSRGGKNQFAAGLRQLL